MPWWEYRMLIEGLNAEAREEDDSASPWSTPSSSSTQPTPAAGLSALGLTVKQV